MLWEVFTLFKGEMRGSEQFHRHRKISHKMSMETYAYHGALITGNVKKMSTILKCHEKFSAYFFYE